MLDTFGREITYLRLSVTDLCNLRCRYCMPPEGICKKEHTQMLTQEEMIQVVRAAASLGVRKLRITGGEPLLKPNILSLCREIAAVPGIEEVCLTTNGTLLKDLAQPLRQAGVHRLNISLDTLDPDKYRKMTISGKLEEAISGIETALDAGFAQIKLNAVLMAGFNDEEIPALVALTRRWPVDVRFIELMPMPGNDPLAGSFLSSSVIPERVPELQDLHTQDGVARLYTLPGAQGRVGLISPMTHHFCSSCSRLRVTADGKVKPCLLSDTEFDLKGQTPEEMQQTLKQAICAKPDSHPTREFHQKGRAMHCIGG